MLLKILLTLLLNISLMFPFFGNKQRYVVIIHNTPVYKTFADSTIVDRVELGSSFVSLNQRGSRMQFEYNGEEVWIDQKNISELDFKEKEFVESPVLFSEISVVNEQYIDFVYDSQLYQIDLSNLEHLKPKLLGKVPKFSQLSASPDRKTLLLTGDSLSKNKPILNLAFYNMESSEFIPLTYFIGDDTTIENSVFSPNGKYLSLYFSINDKQFTHVYDVESQKLVLTKKNILNIAWYGNILFAFSPTKIEFFDSESQFTSKILHTFLNKNNKIIPNGATIGGEYFIQIDDEIYHFHNKELQKTDFRSLDRSPKGFIQHYQRRKQLITQYKGQRLRSLSGAQPRWTFLSILDDNRLLYRTRKDALQILNIYDAIEDESYPYYWIEEPSHTFRSGLSIEFTMEGEDIWLFLENPNNYVKIIRIPEMLK